MSQLTPRLEIASRALAGLCVNATVCISEDPLGSRTAQWALVFADALLAAASQSTDQSEMARTIQRLEGRVELLRTELERAANTWDGDRREQAMRNALDCIRYSAMSALSKDDTEAAK